MTTFLSSLIFLIIGIALGLAYSRKKVSDAKADALRFIVPNRRVDLTPEEVRRWEGFF